MVGLKHAAVPSRNACTTHAKVGNATHTPQRAIPPFNIDGSLVVFIDRGVISVPRFREPVDLDVVARDLDDNPSSLGREHGGLGPQVPDVERRGLGHLRHLQHRPFDADVRGGVAAVDRRHDKVARREWPAPDLGVAGLGPFILDREDVAEA